MGQKQFKPYSEAFFYKGIHPKMLVWDSTKDLGIYLSGIRFYLRFYRGFEQLY